LPSFAPTEYLFPDTLEEATRLLFEFGDRAKIIAGGTMIYELAQKGMIPKIDKLVDLRKLGLDKVSSSKDGIRIGSFVGINELANKKLFEAPPYKVVGESLSKVEPEQVRNVATIGGEICGSTPFFDLPPALIASSAQLIIVGPKGDRITRVEDFFLDYLLTDLRRGEFLKEVFLPRPPGMTGSCFLKYGRTAFDYPLVNMAVRITMDDSKCREARVGACGITPVPARLKTIEKVLEGKKIDDSVIKSACQLIENFHPSGKVHASPWYKLHIAKLLLRDGINTAISRTR
jgi:CO/xanthine dehydrogenase FAD-binding subunit